MTAYFFLWIYLQRSRWRRLQSNSTTTAVFLLNLVSQTASSTCGNRPYIAGGNPQIADFVPQGVAVDSQRLCRAGQVALVGAECCDDELFLEFSPSLVQRYSTSYQLVHDLA